MARPRAQLNAFHNLVIKLNLCLRIRLLKPKKTLKIKNKFHTENLPGDRCPDHKDDGLNASQSYLSERSCQRMNRIILLTSDLEFELVIYSGFEL